MQSKDVGVDTKLVSRLMWFIPFSLTAKCRVTASSESGMIVSQFLTKCPAAVSISHAPHITSLLT